MSNAYELMEADEAEVTMEQAFEMALTDDNFHDVTLEGSDGVRVPAVRSLLALRSKVFRKMLYGNFQEATQAVVKVDYPGAVVKAIVEYIHTNNYEILAQPNHPSVDMDVEEEEEEEEEANKHKNLPEACREVFQTLLALTAAAAYYNLPKLCHKTHDCLSSYMEHFPTLSYAVVEASAQKGAAILEDIKQQSLLSIRNCLSLDLNGHGLEMLSLSGLELVISNDKVIMSERYRFRCIEMWSSINGADQQAKSLIEKHVKLESIDPDFLSTKVTLSGLVTTEQLLEAYQCQAKRAKHELNMTFDIINPMWKTTKSYVFQDREDCWKGDILQGPALTKNHGHQWTVQIAKTIPRRCASVWLGIVSSTAAEMPPDGYCGNVKPSWGIYGYEGQEWSSGEQGGFLGEDAKFKGGSSVVMTLDLSPEEENNGGLSLSVDGKPPILVLGDMCAKLDGIDGFVPAVSCRRAAATIVNMIQF